MANNYFSFKQFTITQNHSAMKVGTDGVLLGAWCECASAGRILDIGAGTGLISLMLAQKSDAHIDAVEIDGGAVADAELNFLNSAWNKQVRIHHSDIQSFSEETSYMYDVIVSNPPFFEKSLKNSDTSKAQARHTDSLSFEDLMKIVAEKLTEAGAFYVVVPADAEKRIDAVAKPFGLYVHKKLYVKTRTDKPPKRLLLKFERFQQFTEVDEIIIEKYGRHRYSEEYLELTKEYYLFA